MTVNEKVAKFCMNLRFQSHCCCLQIDYFNNQIIVDLVEQPHKGIISILDEACLTVGNVTDMVCLDSMDSKLAQHPHYTSRKVRTTQLLPFHHSSSSSVDHKQQSCEFSLKTCWPCQIQHETLITTSRALSTVISACFTVWFCYCVHGAVQFCTAVSRGRSFSTVKVAPDPLCVHTGVSRGLQGSPGVSEALTASFPLQLSPADKSMDFQKHFRIHHYAGDVT